MGESVCRLCLCKDDLLWVFGDKLAKNTKDIISVTCGVEILENEPITQMICGTCCQITIKMYKFRTTSIKNDKELKDKFSQLKPTIAEVPEKDKELLNLIVKVNRSDIDIQKNVNSLSPTNKRLLKYRNAHPSLKTILKKYTTITLPILPIKAHYGPYITLLTNEVDQYFKEQNLSEEKIKDLRRKACLKAISYKNKFKDTAVKSAEKSEKKSVVEPPKPKESKKRVSTETLPHVPKKTFSDDHIVTNLDSTTVQPTVKKTDDKNKLTTQTLPPVKLTLTKDDKPTIPRMTKVPVTDKTVTEALHAQNVAKKIIDDKNKGLLRDSQWTPPKSKTCESIIDPEKQKPQVLVDLKTALEIIKKSSEEEAGQNYGKKIKLSSGISLKPMISPSFKEVVTVDKELVAPSKEVITPAKSVSSVREVITPAKSVSSVKEVITPATSVSSVKEVITPAKSVSSVKEVITPAKSVSSFKEVITPSKSVSLKEMITPSKSGSSVKEVITPAKSTSLIKEVITPAKSSSSIKEVITHAKSASSIKEVITLAKSASSIKEVITPAKSVSSVKEIGTLVKEVVVPVKKVIIPVKEVVIPVDLPVKKVQPSVKNVVTPVKVVVTKEVVTPVKVVTSVKEVVNPVKEVVNPVKEVVTPVIELIPSKEVLSSHKIDVSPKTPSNKPTSADTESINITSLLKSTFENSTNIHQCPMTSDMVSHKSPSTDSISDPTFVSSIYTPSTSRVVTRFSDESKSTERKRKLTVRKTTRPITYNEELTDEIRRNSERIQSKLYIRKSTGKPSSGDKKSPSSDSNKVVKYHDEDSDISTGNVSTVTTSSEASKDRMDVQNDDSSNGSSKSDFVKSLSLAPTDHSAPITDLDTSLITHIKRSCMLYTCKVCDSQHYSLKELKIHERRTHTKCPFCHRRFRTLTNCDEHVKNKCVASFKNIIMKEARLHLTRIDEVDEIKRIYSDAFEYANNDNAPSEGSDVTVIYEPPTEADLEQPTPMEQTAILGIKSAVRELEQQLQMEALTPQNKLVAVDKSSAIATNVDDSTITTDVICISDDEGESNKTKTPLITVVQTEKPKIRVVNNHDIKTISAQDTDICIFKKILKVNNNKKKMEPQKSSSDLLQLKGIEDGESGRVKIFRNLRKHLNEYKIPVELSYGSVLAVKYKPTAIAPAKSVAFLWDGLIPKDIKQYNVNTFSLQTAPTVAQITKSSASKLKTQQKFYLKVQPKPNTVVNAKPGTIPGMAITQVVSSQMGTQQIGTQQIATQRITQQIGTQQMETLQMETQQMGTHQICTQQMGTQQIQSHIGTQQISTQQINTHISTHHITGRHINRPQMTASSSALMLTSMSSLMTTAAQPTYSSSPVILNGSQNISNPNSFTNILLVPTSMMSTQSPNTSVSSNLPAVQAPLPIIQSVVTESEFPPPISTGIRVKNLSELS